MNTSVRKKLLLIDATEEETTTALNLPTINVKFCFRSHKWSIEYTHEQATVNYRAIVPGLFFRESNRSINAVFLPVEP